MRVSCFCLVIAVFCAPARAGAQNLLRLSSDGLATLTGSVGGGVTTQSPNDTPLSTGVNFGELGPGNTNAFVCFTQPIALRANVASSVQAALTVESFGPSAAHLQKDDIGIGFQNLRRGGPDALLDTTSIVAPFAADPCAAPKDTDDVPSYSATLASLATGLPGTTVIRSTGPMSDPGALEEPDDLSDPDNRVVVDLRLAIAPQAFTAGSFSTTITLTLTNP